MIPILMLMTLIFAEGLFWIWADSLWAWSYMYICCLAHNREFQLASRETWKSYKKWAKWYGWRLCRLASSACIEEHPCSNPIFLSHLILFYFYSKHLKLSQQRKQENWKPRTQKIYSRETGSINYRMTWR